MSDEAEQPGRDAAVRTVTDALAVPFEPAEVKWKPQSVKGNRALAMAYIDARHVMDRLDEVVGCENWRDAYTVYPSGDVECRLSVRLGGEWVEKADVGSQSEQPDGGDRLKAAYSDALKRAAVKFGIGRYLYRLPAQWADYDPVKKQFAGTPALPAFARPPARKAERRPEPEHERPAAKKAAAAGHPLPENGAELHRRLRDYDAKLAGQKLCPLGALLAHVTQAGVRAGFGADVTGWPAAAVSLAADEVKAFESSLRGADGRGERRPA